MIPLWVNIGHLVNLGDTVVLAVFSLYVFALKNYMAMKIYLDTNYFIFSDSFLKTDLQEWVYDVKMGKNFLLASINYHTHSF